LAGVTLSASGVRAPSKDSRGVATSYDPARAVDDDATTAWRADGQSGQTLVLRFPRPVALHRVGLIPGLAKTDPGDGTDRYAQNRRITAARLVVSDGSATNVEFDGSPGNRSMQWADIGTVVTDSLTITVVSSTPGSPQGGQPAYETVAISEIDVG
jgi:hypothetical protein